MAVAFELSLAVATANARLILVAGAFDRMLAVVPNDTFVGVVLDSEQAMALPNLSVRTIVDVIG